MVSKPQCLSLLVGVLLPHCSRLSAQYLDLTNQPSAAVLLNKREFIWSSYISSLPVSSLTAWNWCKILIQRGGRVHGCRERRVWRYAYCLWSLGSRWWNPGSSRLLILAVHIHYLGTCWAWRLWTCIPTWYWPWLLLHSRKEPGQQPRRKDSR